MTQGSIMWHSLRRWVFHTSALFIFVEGIALAQSPPLTVRLHAPKAGQVFAWGREAPTLTIQSSVEEEGNPLAGARLFQTAVVLSGEQLIDRVPLYDDGSHGDTRANDGIYTAPYRPAKPQAYTIKVRATGGRVPTWEGWSQPVSIFVEQIPYPHIVYPEPGSKVGRSLTLRARLMQGEQPFVQDDATLKAEVVWTDEQGVKHSVDPSEVRRRGSLLTCPVEFLHLGRHEMRVTVSVERHGKRIGAEGVPVRVDVAKAPMMLLFVAVMLLALTFLLPPKKPVALYRHILQIRNTNTNQRLDITIEPMGLQPVKRTVGGQRCDFVLEGVSGTLCTLTAEPGSAQLLIEAAQGKQLRIGGSTQSQATIQPRRSNMAFRIAEFEFYYADAKIVQTHRFSRLKPTLPKAIIFFTALTVGALGWWQYSQFFRQ